MEQRQVQALNTKEARMTAGLDMANVATTRPHSRRDRHSRLRRSPGRALCSARAGASRAGLRRHRGRARAQRRRPRDRQAPRSGEAPCLHRRAPGHEGARYGRRRRLQHRIDGARGGSERHGLWAERPRSRRPGEGADRGAHANPGDEERRHAGAAVRRPAARRCGRFGPHHLLFLLSRHRPTWRSIAPR